MLYFQTVHVQYPFVKYMERNWNTIEAVHQLFEDLKKVYDSFRREGLYNILIEFGISMNLERLIKMSE